MSLLNSLGLNGLMGQNHQQLTNQANQAFNNAYNNYQQGLLGQAGLAQAAQQYNSQLWQSQVRQETKWKFNGVDVNVRDMANSIWPTDCAEKTHFLLKYE